MDGMYPTLWLLMYRLLARANVDTLGTVVCLLMIARPAPRWGVLAVLSLFLWALGNGIALAVRGRHR